MNRPNLRMLLVGLAWIAGAGALVGACTDDATFGDPTPANCAVEGVLCALSCDPSIGCVQCQSDGDCGAVSPFCVAGECEECRDNTSCMPGQSCFPENHECSDACVDGGDCPDGDAPICDVPSGACVGCITNSDCDGDTPICSPITKQCGECATNDHCGVAQPICDIEDGECRECLVDSQCDANEVCNDKECRLSCTNNNDCTDGDKPLCNTTSGNCVVCLNDVDCPIAAPACTDNGRCVVCENNADCGDPELPICKDNKACVECTEDNHCDLGFKCSGQECVAEG